MFILFYICRVPPMIKAENEQGPEGEWGLKLKNREYVEDESFLTFFGLSDSFPSIPSPRFCFPHILKVLSSFLSHTVSESTCWPGINGWNLTNQKLTMASPSSSQWYNTYRLNDTVILFEVLMYLNRTSKLTPTFVTYDLFLRSWDGDIYEEEEVPSAGLVQ